MTKQKTPAPVDSLFDQDYKLSYFCKGLSKFRVNDNNNFRHKFKEKCIESGLFTLKRIPGTYESF